MSSGMIIENVTEQINPRRMAQKRAALTGSAQTIDLEAAYRNVELWPDDDAATVHYRINPNGTETDADTDDPLIPLGGVILDTFTEGVRYVYVIATAATGSLNVRAW